ncbi:MAG: pilin [Patescibacteria group bacterium]|nr:pilin [Patescibacteria group bacterium]
MITNPVLPEFEIGTLIGNFIGLFIIIAGIMVLIYLVWGGVEWISSAGDKAAIEGARNRITNALIGLGIVVAAWAIMTLTSDFFGLNFPNLPIPSLSGDRVSETKTSKENCRKNCLAGSKSALEQNQCLTACK